MNNKVIFLDWYGTLSDSKFWDHLSEDENRQIEKSLFGDLKHLLTPWMKGQFSTEDIISMLSVNTKLNTEYLLKEFIFSCQNMKISESVFQLIKDLRDSGHKIYIATDNMDSFSRWTVPSLNLNTHFDGILNSFNLRSLKREFDKEGNSLFFEKFINENNFHPEDCILIDDSEDKDNLIQKYGLTYHKIDDSSELENILTNLL